jgi:signal transduction histidine kinase
VSGLKLRLRLTLATCAVAVPVVVGLYWLDARARHLAAQEALASFTESYMQRAGERLRCEQGDETWGLELIFASDVHAHDFHSDQRHGKTPVLCAYDEDGRNRHPHLSMPREIPPETIVRLREEPYVASEYSWLSPDVEVTLRMKGANGPCTYVVAQGTTVPGWLGALLPSNQLWLVPTLVMVLTVAVAVGPIVRRIRSLAHEVQRSAASGYLQDVGIHGKDELAELAAAFNRAGAAIREQMMASDRREQALRCFVADTTHDIMTPLTVLQGHLAKLRERVNGGESASETIALAMTEAHYIGSLLQNLGLAASMSTGDVQLNLSEVNLNDLVRRVILRHRPIARQLEVGLESAVPRETIAVVADLTMVEQVVNNLVYNAVRHNRSGGHVAVILDAASNGGFTMAINDDGPGLTNEELTRVMERRFAGNVSRSRAPKGHGIGLDIVFRVVKMHGFDLEFFHAEGGGLSVVLSGNPSSAIEKSVHNLD